MRAQRIFDESASAAFRPQLQSAEISHVVVVEKHVADGDDALVDFVGVACENDAFGDDALG